MAQPVSYHRPVKILSVDDDPYLTDLLRYALTREGYNVQIAESSASALRLVEIDPPDLAIVDVCLPDLSGFSLCSRLRYDFGIQVIMLTARHSDQDVITSFEQGAEDFVSKPFSMQILLARVHALGDRRSLATSCRRVAQAFGRISATASATSGSAAGRSTSSARSVRASA